MSMTVYHPNVEKAIRSYSPVFVPTGAANRRPARCRQCSRRLAAGEGRQWDFTAEAYQLIRHDSSCYYCPDCHRGKYELLQLEPEIQAELERIREWCNSYVTLQQPLPAEGNPHNDQCGAGQGWLAGNGGAGSAGIGSDIIPSTTVRPVPPQAGRWLLLSPDYGIITGKGRMEETPQYTVDMTQTTLDRLLLAMGLDRLTRLADLLDEVIDDSGWGDITIVVAERRVVGIKAGKSYK